MAGSWIFGEMPFPETFPYSPVTRPPRETPP